MIEIGKYNELQVSHAQPDLVLLAGGVFGTIKLVTKQAERFTVGDCIRVFVYLDASENVVATQARALAEVDQCAYLKVVDINDTGAFLDWGLPKDLLVPYNQQRYDLQLGKKYVVRVFCDPETKRIAASTRLDNYIRDQSHGYRVGQKVDALVAESTEIGYKVIVDHLYWGLLYKNEVFEPLRIGQRFDAYVKKVREDQRLDLNRHAPGQGKLDAIAEKITTRLTEHDGFLMITDKSKPEVIYSLFGVSKKAYKQAVGRLYKTGVIQIEANGIRLVKN